MDEIMRKRILIIGANGFIGQALLIHLHAMGHRVTGCVRDAKRFPRHLHTIRVVEADYTTHTSADQWLPLVQGFDVVINAVGIIRERGASSFEQIHTRGPIMLFDAALAAGVKRIVQISALGSDITAVTPFHLSKRAADAHLAESDSDWLILRPSLVYGNGGKSSMLFKAVAALPLIPVAGDGSQPVQTVAVEDLAHIVASFIEGKFTPRQYLDVVGAKAISIREMFGLYRQWLGLSKPRFISIPERPALWLAHRLGLFGIATSSDETVALLRRGSTADVKRLMQQTGIAPSPMDEALMRSPAQQADCWHARLYFLHPLLRSVLGIMWIWTALISAGIYPIEKSMALLAAVGLSGPLAVAALCSGVLLDLLTGLAFLLRVHVKAAAWIQIAAMTTYTLIITSALPEYWLHPFGPIIKNLPLAVATLILIAMEA